MRRLVQRIDQLLARPAVGWVLLLGVVVLYALAYCEHNLFPGHGHGAESRGWWTWADQSRYLKEAAAIAEGRLDRASYQYPAGYPAVGALFWRWMPVHPFFWPNMVLIAVTAVCWWRLARRWLSPLAALAAAVLFLATHRWLVADSWVVPWNTLLTQCTLLAGIWLFVAHSGSRTLWWLALLSAATYVTRPIDAVSFIPLLVAATARLGSWQKRLGHGLGALALIASAVVGVGCLNLAVFGAWRTPYEVTSTQTIGFCAYPVSYKAFWLLVDGRPLFGETDPALLFRYPWLFLVLPATIWWIRADRAKAVAPLFAIGVSWFVYLNYNDFLPSDVYRFTLIHYLAWSFPLLFLGVAAAVLRDWRSAAFRWGMAGAAVLFVIAAGLRMDVRALPSAARTEQGWRLPPNRPLLIQHPGVPTSAVSELRVDGRPLTEYSDYLIPYVPADLRMLLSGRRGGQWLSVSAAAEPFNAPAFAEYVWRWRLNPGRLKRIGR